MKLSAFKFPGTNSRCQASLGLEPLEDRRLMASGYCNSFNAFDVDDNVAVGPLDALLVINELTANGARVLPPVSESPRYYVDVNNDGALTPLDALRVINQIDRIARANMRVPVVTGGLAPDSDPDGNGVVLQGHVTIAGQTVPGARVRLRSAELSGEVGAGHGANGLHANADADGHFRFEIDVPAGLSTLRLAAVDALGQSTEVVRTVRFGDVILDWNASLLEVIRDWTTLSNDPYLDRVVPERPPVAARNLAMVHAAMYDAVNAIDRAHRPYHVDRVAPPGTSPVAAAAAAAHQVASRLYPQNDERAVFDAALAEALATVPEGTAKSQGLVLGRQVGDAILAWRGADGAATAVSYAPGTEPGEWQRTFPDFLPPLLPQWPSVMPFAMTGGSQFRPLAPPALDSTEYAAAVDEVMQLGGLRSTARTAEQTETVLFWADGGGTWTPPGHWNQIAADVALDHRNSLAENAHLFALLNIALADAGIASWDAKYAYKLWRPIDAIRRGDLDGNFQTGADPKWTPLLKTPPFPTYTSGHSTFSGAADAVLTAYFGPNFRFSSQSDGHTGFDQRPLAADQIVRRSFDSFSQAAEEAGRSRVYGGIHFQFDNSAGLAAGRALGSYVIGHFLL